MHFTRVAAIASVAMLVALVSAPSVSFAHERRTIGGGKYDVVVGWDVEPAFAGLKNAASIRISRAGTNPAEAITGAEKTVAIEIRQGAQTRQFALRTVFGQPGYYVADIQPTREGEYQWTFTGLIGDDKINEKFDTADGKFHKVETLSSLQFPVALPDPAQVNTEIQGARAAAQSAQTTAMIGIAVGALAVLGMLVMSMTRPRRHEPSLSPRGAPVDRSS